MKKETFCIAVLLIGVITLGILLICVCCSESEYIDKHKQTEVVYVQFPEYDVTHEAPEGAIILTSSMMTGDVPQQEEQPEAVETVLYWDCPMDESHQDYLKTCCRDYGVDERIMMAIIGHESVWNPDAVGDDGASIGYVQYNSINWPHAVSRGLNIYDPEDNIELGVEFFENCCAQLQDTDLGLCGCITAYNMGVEGAKLWYQEHPGQQPPYTVAVLDVWYRLSTKQSN